MPQRELLRGLLGEPLERLALHLLEHAGARARSAEITVDLRAIGRFFKEEASELAAAIAATGSRATRCPSATATSSSSAIAPRRSYEADRFSDLLLIAAVRVRSNHSPIGGSARRR